MSMHRFDRENNHAFMFRLLVLLPLLLWMTSCSLRGDQLEPAIHKHTATGTVAVRTENSDQNALSVMTLNIAHGRGDSFHQLFQSTEAARTNLVSIAALLQREAPDVVSLQEADSQSIWNGNFDHVAFIAEKGAFTRSVRGTHVKAAGLAYGTALVTNRELGNPQAITFKPGLLPIPKGFVVSTVTWPGNECVEVDIASVHLDFISESSRRKQAAELIAVLRDRNRPVIVMGDLNSEWQQPDSAVRLIADELGLHTYQPDNTALATFPSFGARLDWILVSPEISFRSYRIIGDVISDHLGVFSELTISRSCPTSSL
jgi:endonuclease/exonuclease/phosphatase family metal-dependent hydrolase